MAGRKLTISATAIALGTGTQHQVLIEPGEHVPARITRLAIGPVGTSNTEARVKYTIYTNPTAATAGTAMTVSQSGGHSKGVGNIQLTASSKPTSVDLTNARVVKRGVFLPNGPYEVPLTIDLNANENLIITTDVATSQTCEFSIEGEE